MIISKFINVNNKHNFCNNYLFKIYHYTSYLKRKNFCIRKKNFNLRKRNEVWGTENSHRESNQRNKVDYNTISKQKWKNCDTLVQGCIVVQQRPDYGKIRHSWVKILQITFRCLFINLLSTFLIFFIYSRQWTGKELFLNSMKHFKVPCGTLYYSTAVFWLKKKINLMLNES